jgi:PmbA protein
MERLLTLAKAVSDQAEVYSRDVRRNGVRFDDGKLHDVQTTLQSGVSLRIVKDGKLGFAYTRNLVDREELLENALASLAGGVAADYELPRTEGLPELPTYDPAVEEITSASMVEELTRIADSLRARADGEIRLAAETGVTEVRLANSHGTDLSARTGGFVVGGGLVIPGSGTGFARAHDARRFEPWPGAYLEEVVSLYLASRKDAKPAGGRMKVLFMPMSLIALVWRLQSGTSAKSVYEGISPLAGKVGERIFDAKLTLCDEPRHPEHLEARPFDDEGTPCDRFPLVEDGVLRGFYNSLEYAKKLGVPPTGHGWREAMWSRDPVAVPPAPFVLNLRCVPGEHSFAELVSMMDRGLILEGTLGAHSGNIPNGDYSVGASPGLYVEDGVIVGRVRDAMVAGNVYDTLRSVAAIGDSPRHSFLGRLPPILCDDVNVTIA